MGRTALELVGQGMMGYSFDPLTEEVHNDFAEAVKSFVCVLWLVFILETICEADRPCRPSFSAIQWTRVFAPFVMKLGSARFRRFLLDRVPSVAVQRMKKVCDVMHQRSLDIYNEKKAAIERGDRETLLAVGERKDMLSILRAQSFMLPVRWDC